MGQGPTPRGLFCPICGAGLVPLDDPPTDAQGPAHRMRCPRCVETFRARRRASPSGQEPEPPSTIGLPPAGPFALLWRGAALRGLEAFYRAAILGGSTLLFAAGGFVPVARAWLRDEVDSWGGVLELLGGLKVETPTRDPDADLGPVLAYTDAPLLFTAVGEVARKLGVRPPGQIRLTYLPCCGVVAWGRSRALILGLPLLRVLTLGELRAVLAHELAHLARGDATRAARSARFVAGLRKAVADADVENEAHGRRRGRGPLGVLARVTCRVATALIAPIARGQEARADRSSAAIAGGSVAASALVKVALVQPLFREVLEIYDPADPDAPNLYAFFRTFWYRLPAEVHSAMRLRLMAGGDLSQDDDPTHPPLPDRLAALQSYPDPASPTPAADLQPATASLGDLEGFEEMLHNRLYAIAPVEPSIYHKAGT